MWATNLVVEEALLHAVVGADLLQYVPGEFLVQLPRYVCERYRGDGDDTRDGDEEGSTPQPDVVFAQVIGPDGTVRLEQINGISDLVDLQSRVGQQGRVAYAEADDLNGVFAAQSVPYQYQLVDKGEDEER